MKGRFDQDRADRAISFFETLLVHTKSPWARQPFILAPFQRDIINALFGEVVKDPDSGIWVRKHTLAWLEMGRKNGKSELLAGIALLLTGADDEEGAEVYGLARDVEQATHVFKVARRMVELSSLSKHFRVYPRYRQIVYPKTDSVYQVVPGDAIGNLGANPHGIVFDEIIAQPNGDLWGAMKTGFGTRMQPLMVAATTAGDDPNSFAKTEHDELLRVTEDPALAPRTFVYIRSIPKDKDIGDEANWSLANPALGLFLRPQVIRDEWHEAQDSPHKMRWFKQFRANQWLDSTSMAWVSLEDWDATAGKDFLTVDVKALEERFKGKRAFGGLVAASVDDLTALCWTFPPDEDEDWHTFWRFFLPEDRLPDLISRTEGKAQQWADEGRLTLTEGDQIDVAAHVEQVEKDFEIFNVKQFAHDTHGIIGIVQQLMPSHPKAIIGIAPNTPGTALLDWERLILAKQYLHGANPIVRWELGHTMVKESSAGVLRIDRKNSVEDVSGVYAAELALRRGLLEVRHQSPYETGGLMTL